MSWAERSLGGLLGPLAPPPPQYMSGPGRPRERERDRMEPLHPSAQYDHQELGVGPPESAPPLQYVSGFGRPGEMDWVHPNCAQISRLCTVGNTPLQSAWAGSQRMRVASCAASQGVRPGVVCAVSAG